MDLITLVLAGLGFASPLKKLIKLLLNPEDRSKFIKKLQGAIFSLLSDEKELEACKQEVTAAQEMMQRYYGNKGQAISDTIERLRNLCNDLTQVISQVQERTHLLNKEFQRLSDLEEKKAQKNSKSFAAVRADVLAAQSFVNSSQLLMAATTTSKTSPESDDPFDDAIEKLTGPVKKSAQEKIQEAKEFLNKNVYIIEVNKYYASLNSQNEEQSENKISQKDENKAGRAKVAKKIIITISSIALGVAALAEGWNAFCTQQPENVVCPQKKAK